MPDAGRQMWKNGVPKMLSSHHWKTEMSKNKTKKVEKKGTKRNGESKKNDEKKKKRWTRTTENDPSHDKNDSWSDHPETQFGPTYPFFRNPEPRPTLRAVKVHFDWTWILRLKRFFLREFSSKIILINHPPIWDEFWIFECIMGQSKKNEKTWL